jgi:hypothetical protein
MLSTAWAVRQTNREANRLYIKNVKPRDFEPCQPFELEGRPWIDKQGAFKMTAQPGMARVSVAPKAETWEVTEARAMRKAGHTQQQIADHVKKSLSTIEKWERSGKLKPVKDPEPVIN